MVAHIRFRTLSFTDIGTSCHSREFLQSQICFLTHIVKIKFSLKLPDLQFLISRPWERIWDRILNKKNDFVFFLFILNSFKLVPFSYNMTTFAWYSIRCKNNCNTKIGGRSAHSLAATAFLCTLILIFLQKQLKANLLPVINDKKYLLVFLVAILRMGDLRLSGSIYTKEQIYFYERAEYHKAKERMFESVKWANFPGKHADAGVGQGFLERGFIYIQLWGFAIMILSHLS